MGGNLWLVNGGSRHVKYIPSGICGDDPGESIEPVAKELIQRCLCEQDKLDAHFNRA